MTRKIILITLPLTVLAAGLVFWNFSLKRNNGFSPAQDMINSIPQEIMGNSILTNPVPAKNKKVILITIDNIRPDHLGTYGYERNTSPNIDKIAKNSVVFKNAYVPSPSTVPAHISMFTGLHSRDFKVFSNGTINREINNISLASLFKNKGYGTAAFIGTGLLNVDFFKKGFDTFDFEPENDVRQPDASIEGFPWVIERSNVKTNEKVTSWLDQNYNNDFFLFIHYYDASPPFNNNCGADFGQNLQPPSNGIFSNGTVVPFIKTTDQDMEFLKAKYDEGIFCDDKSVGELVEKLKSLKIYEDATVIIVSDHGEYFDHSLLFHGYTLFQESIKITMIVKSPLLKISKDASEIPVMLLDIFPTLARTFKLAEDDKGLMDSFNLGDSYSRDLFFITPNLAGEGFLEMVKILPKEFLDESIIKQDPNFYEAIIDRDDKKTIMSGENVEGLYDLSVDSRETSNLKGNNSYSKVENEEKIKIEKFFKEISLNDLPINFSDVLQNSN